jgi:hypothetical protein
MLGKAPADFNPIRDYYAFKAGYPVFRPKIVEPIYTPVKITQNETFPPASDDYLISLLQPRFQADDVPGFGGRAQELEKVFATLPRDNAAKLLTRLAARSPGDRVAGYFHGHLATATRNKLIKILAGSAAR